MLPPEISGRKHEKCKHCPDLSAPLAQDPAAAVRAGRSVGLVATAVVVCRHRGSVRVQLFHQISLYGYAGATRLVRPGSITPASLVAEMAIMRSTAARRP